MSTRMLIPVQLMGIADMVSRRSTCSCKHAVGALIVVDDRIAATGYNGSLPGEEHCDDVGCVLDSDGRCTRAIHAELNAILQCAKRGQSTFGADLYTTLAPCERCARAIIQAGIERVFFCERSSSEALNLLHNNGIYVEQVELFEPKPKEKSNA